MRGKIVKGSGWSMGITRSLVAAFPRGPMENEKPKGMVVQGELFGWYHESPEESSWWSVERWVAEEVKKDGAKRLSFLEIEFLSLDRRKRVVVILKGDHKQTLTV